jgi:hypothetical protein
MLMYVTFCAGFDPAQLLMLTQMLTLSACTNITSLLQVMALEAEAQSVSAMSTPDALEARFAALEGGSGVEEELRALKAQQQSEYTLPCLVLPAAVWTVSVVYLPQPSLPACMCSFALHKSTRLSCTCLM